VGRIRIALSILAAVAACKREPEVEIPPELDIVRPQSTSIKRVRPSMGTYVEITFSGISEAQANRAADAVFAELDRIERLMSEWRPDSELSAVNAAAGERPVVVERELLDLVARAVEFSEKTKGAFDPTFAAMWGLWTFGDDGVTTLPDPEEVGRRRALIDRRRVKLDPSKSTIFLEAKGMKLGLGGIAKGYATDRAVALLREHGARHFLLKAGGELFASGRNGGQRWRVGLRDPRSEGHFAEIELEDLSFGTSGDYERFFLANGVRYHHIIDPKTGYPATQSRSATVLAKDAITSDALSKALFILGPEEGMALMEAMGVEAVLVTADNRVLSTPGLEGRLVIHRQPSP
jgi:thiamine biosynthesis lipoprotein